MNTILGAPLDKIAGMLLANRGSMMLVEPGTLAIFDVTFENKDDPQFNWTESAVVFRDPQIGEVRVLEREIQVVVCD